MLEDTSLKSRIQQDRIAALKTHDKVRATAISFILAALKQIEVDERITLDDDRVLQILNKLVKQRRESITQYKAANRQDLVDKEEFELAIIQEYLPQQLSVEEVQHLVQEAITATGATSQREMGKVMGYLKPKLAGRADLSSVSEQIKTILND